MAFTDRVVEYPNRFDLIDGEGNTTGTYTLQRNEGEITEEGTPLNASNMNDAISEATEIAYKKYGIQGGTVSVKTKAKETKAVKVSFKKPFAQIPVVTATPYATVPSKMSVSVGSITTTGFTVYLYRTNAATTKVGWQASGVIA